VEIARPARIRSRRNSSGAAPELSIWAVSDGRVGIEAQVLGLAEAIARERPATLQVKRIGWRFGLGRLPWRMIPMAALRAESPLAGPWPDIWVGAGRASLPLSTRVSAWSGGTTFVVQTQDPGGAASALDLVIPPLHDELEGENVFPILGSPTRMHAEGSARDLAAFRARIEPLPRPRVAMVVGGRSNAHNLPPARARAMAAEVAHAVRQAGGSLLLSFTRRTPRAARKAMIAALGDLPGWTWDGAGANPYFAFLAAADAILVTEDSVNLATDAATTGKPVHVLAMAGGGVKFDRFHADLRRLGVARPFDGRLATWSYKPLDETRRAAREVLRRYDAFRAKTQR
jgi:mitochondrial fission protein ELM1